MSGTALERVRGDLVDGFGKGFGRGWITVSGHGQGAGSCARFATRNPGRGWSPGDLEGSFGRRPGSLESHSKATLNVLEGESESGRGRAAETGRASYRDGGGLRGDPCRACVFRHPLSCGRCDP